MRCAAVQDFQRFFELDPVEQHGGYKDRSREDQDGQGDLQNPQQQEENFCAGGRLRLVNHDRLGLAKVHKTAVIWKKKPALDTSDKGADGKEGRQKQSEKHHRKQCIF